ncbi:MOSC domain-containing protein YiiM [Fontibacillus phaseoli]|uniref:MOSC domain-containing protein YiiM n=1 Tax=Fontibacillus phaseoli TaxID=1416533 RepID=A0A369BV05_9BACL|nr:MOSC domain-containing protein [Fontibacillus phaseoli]RCX23444.1 MOSC domain-containing protein YiiM [Fontibacillus phaseoli]
MKKVEIVSLNTGKPQMIPYQKKEVLSGIYKQPGQVALFLSWVNLEGDGQADLVHHGGRDKAVCVYPYEHYSFWEGELGSELEFGAFGENLTTRGLLENELCIGDIYQLGEAVVQVSQPRQPCYKLSARYGAPDMPLKVQETGFTGYYFRVLQEGRVSRSEGLTLISRHPKEITVSFANHIMHREKDSLDDIRRILEVEELSESWRITFLKRLEGHEKSTAERLTGNLE